MLGCVRCRKLLYNDVDRTNSYVFRISTELHIRRTLRAARSTDTCTETKRL